MPRTRSRASRLRRRIVASLREVIRKARNDANAPRRRQAPPQDNGALWQLLRDINRSPLCVWDVARDVKCTEEERAMIAQVVAPHLAGMTPRDVLKRRM